MRYLLCHKAGLAAISQPLPAEARYDWEQMTRALAEQEPWWEPGTRHGYHALTFGYLVGEVVRRIDGRSLGTYFREEVAAPLGADFHVTRFGLGFFLTHPTIPFGPNPRSVGHPGAGGSIGFADSDTKLGFGYVMNQMQPGTRTLTG